MQFCLSSHSFKYKWVVNAIINIYYISWVITISAFCMAAFIYFSPMLEPSFLMSSIFIIIGIIEGTVPVLIMRNYFKTSIRVKNTYIK